MGRLGLLGWFAASAWLVVPAQASAQNAAAIITQPTVDNNMIIGFSHPSVAADGFVINNCVYPQANCATFNASMCDPNYKGLPIQMSVQRGSAAAAPANVKAYFWVQPNNNTCTGSPLSGNSIFPNPAAATLTPLLSTSSFVGGSQAITIPNDFSFSSFTLDTRTIMQEAFPGTCSGAGVTYTRWRLCLGIDSDNDGYINPPSGGTTDVTGFFEFLVDTALPGSPNIISTTSLYKRVTVKVSYNIGFESLYGIVVRSTSEAANLNSGDCNSWVGQVNEQLVHLGYGGTGSGELDVTVPGTNGEQYAYCAAVIDVVGNRSAFAGPALDSPHPECDLFDCYPPETVGGAFVTGFGDGGGCTSGLPAGLWVSTALVWWNVRRRRRRPLWNAGWTSVK